MTFHANGIELSPLAEQQLSQNPEANARLTLVADAFGFDRPGGSLGLGGIAGACYARAWFGSPDKGNGQQEPDALDMFAGNLYTNLIRGVKV